MARSSRITAATTREPAGHGQDVEQSPAVLLGEQRHADRGGREDKADEQSVEHDDAEIARPAPAAAECLLPARRQQFPKRHGGEDAGKAAQADSGLMRKEDLNHWSRAKSLDRRGGLSHYSINSLNDVTRPANANVKREPEASSVRPVRGRGEGGGASASA